MEKSNRLEFMRIVEGQEQIPEHIAQAIADPEAMELARLAFPGPGEGVRHDSYVALQRLLEEKHGITSSGESIYTAVSLHDRLMEEALKDLMDEK